MFSGEILVSSSNIDAMSPESHIFPFWRASWLPLAISFDVPGKSLGPVSCLGNISVDVASLLEGVAWYLTLR
jgi:hypothetical protein